MSRLWKLLNAPLIRPKARGGNVCCKCDYDLTSVAEPPPALVEPGLLCPECGRPVALRDNWRTDGRHSIPMLVFASWLIALAAATAKIVVSIRHGPLRPANPFPPFHPVSFVIAALPIFTLLAIGPYVMLRQATRGTVYPAHETKRRIPAYVPFAIVFVAYMIFGHRILDWLSS